MKTKADFQSAIASAIARYPVASQYYQARDQRLIAQLDAAAAMFAMLSAEMDVQSMEQYTKARDVTVLADAAAKGFLPYAKPSKVRILVSNNDTTKNFVINIGDRIQDDQGRVWTAESAVTVYPTTTGTFQASQYQMDTITQFTQQDIPFMTVKIDKPDDGMKYASISVEDGYTGTPYRFAAAYTNVEIDEKAYHIISDENQDLFVKFGARGIVGYQHALNEAFVIRYKRTMGQIELPAETKFTHQYAFTYYEDTSEMTIDEVLAVGENSIDIATLREILNYPSVYDENAVFLGNFDFLIRRNLSPFEFLSVWNEQREETIRGPSVNNINKLFVAASKEGVDSTTLQSMITKVIQSADDSYKIGYVDIIEEEIDVTITGYISPIYDFNEVGFKIKELILKNYGKLSPFAKRRAKIPYKNIYDLLRKNIAAFQDETSDIRVSVVYAGNDDGEARVSLAYTRTSTTVVITYPDHGIIVGEAFYVSSATDSGLNYQQIATVTSSSEISFETTSSGADTGTLSVTIQPHPEKWRYVSEASLTISVQQAIQ